MSQILRRYPLLNDASAMYIHEKDNWAAFRWNATELTAILEEVNRKNGYTGMLIRCRLHLTKRKISSVPS